MVPAAPATLPTMLLRLSRLSFWLAAAVAALALLAPGGHETLLTALTGAASVLALGLWRAALRGEERRPLAALVDAPAAPVLDDSSLNDAAALLVHRAHDAGSFEAALHAVAQVLRSELGAREARVYEVHGVDDSHAQLSDLIESQPGFRTVPRRLRLDAAPLARALRTRLEAGIPPGTVALPVSRCGQVVAAIELSAIDLPLDPKALAGLLALAGSTLSQLAAEAAEPAPAMTSRRAATPGRRAEDQQRRAAHPPFPPRLQAVHANVLVVEDNVVQPERTTRMLRRLGCRVSVASGMLDGLDQLCRRQFSLVFIDMQMSGMDGAEGLRRLRHDPGGAHRFMSARDTPMIALSVPGLPGDGERLRQLGFDDHLFKPFRQSEMLAMLSKHLGPAVPAASTDAPPEPERLAVLDAVALARLSELDPTGENRLLERVLHAFQGSVARLRPQLDEARRAGNHTQIRLVVHTLKSSSASIGALQLSQLCAQVEAAIRLDATADLAGPLGSLDAALDGALQAIDALLKDRV